MNKLLPIFYATPLILLSIGIGYCLSVATELNWASGSLFSAVAMILVGTWIFEDDAESMIDDMGKGMKEAKELRKDVRTNNTINYLLVLILAGLGIWLQVSI